MSAGLLTCRMRRSTSHRPRPSRRSPHPPVRRRSDTATSSGSEIATSSNTILEEKRGAAFQQPRNSSTSHPASCSSRYPAIPAAMPASPSTQATAGSCIAVTPSTTTAPWTGAHVPRTLWTMETLVAFDRKKMWDNHARLSELYAKAEPDLMHRARARHRRCSNVRRPRRTVPPRAPALPCRCSLGRPGSDAPHRRWRTGRLRGRPGRRPRLPTLR